MSIDHQEFLSRIKKTLYYGPSNPNRMTSFPLANHVSNIFNESHRNYSLNTLDLDTISRIRQQTPCSLLLTIIYLERINKLDPAFVKLVSPSELFLVSLMISAKFYSYYDEMEVFANAWAEEGRIDAERLKQLEISFLNAIEWNLIVSDHEFYEKLKTVERLLAMKEGLSRGWYTYTELELLMPSIEIAKRILNYTTMLMFSYACVIATIALSSVIVASIPPAFLASRGNSTTALQAPSLLPNAMISFNQATLTYTERTFDIFNVEKEQNLLALELKVARNFTINYLDVPYFQLVTQEIYPVPLCW